jgi:hypothetical protein
MGTQEAPGSEAPEWIRVWRLLWLPALPEAASGLPMTEVHGGLRATSVLSVSPWSFLFFEFNSV